MRVFTSYTVGGKAANCYPGHVATELQQIRKRIEQRKALDQADRERQRELVKQRIAEGVTWVAIQDEAGISKMTISEILHGKRRRRKAK